MKGRGILFILIMVFLFIGALGGCSSKKNTQEKRPSIVITKKEIKEYENFRKQFYRQNISDTEAEKYLIEEKVLLKEAEKRKIRVTKEEVKTEVQIQKKAFENMNQQERQSFIKMINDQKISVDQYWNSTVPKALKKLLIKGDVEKAIKDEILKDIMDNKELAAKTYKIDMDKLYQSKIQSIIKKYTVITK